MDEQTTDLRLLISAPFSGMEEERDYLKRCIFPELRSLCSERGVTFTEVDLHWNSQRQQGNRHRIVERTLHEIAERTPYIFGLLSDHYGWIPTLDDIAGDGLIDRFLWLKEEVEGGKSLMEIESLLLPSHIPAMEDHVRFYFREPSTFDGEEKDAHPARLFRQRVRESGRPIADYRTVVELGGLIRRDLLAILDAIAPMSGGRDSWLDRERQGHRAFAESRRRAYIPHEPTFARLDHFALSDDGESRRSDPTPPGRIGPLVIAGESGGGKSALLACWVARFREAHPEHLVIEHYVGATHGSRNRSALLRRIMLELAEQLNLTDTLPTGSDEIEAIFPSWLARAGERRVVIVIDGLNQLENTGNIDWLPHDFSPNIRILLSTLPGRLLEDIEGRGWERIAVHPLTKEERRRAVRAYLGTAGSHLTARQTGRIADRRQGANPLYLRTGLEELRATRDRSQTDRQIDAYLEADDLADLYTRLFRRLEEAFGGEMIRDLLSSLWASCDGLSPHDLAGILDRPVVQINELLAAIDSHLIYRNGLITFHHELLRKRIEHSYLASATGKRNVHRKVAAWFAMQPVSERRAVEELAGCRESGDWDGMITALSNRDLFLLMNSGENQLRLLGDWQRLVVEKEIEEVLDAITSSLGAEDLSGRKTYLQSVASLLHTAGHYIEAARIAGDCQRELVESGLSHTITVAELNALGRYQTDAGMFDDARRTYDRAIALAEANDRNGESRSIEYAASLEGKGALCFQLKEFAEGEKLCIEALAIRTERQGKDHPDTVETLGTIGAMAYGRGDYAEAETRLREQLLQLQRQPNYSATFEFGTCLNNLGTALCRLERNSEAVELFWQGLGIYESIYGPNHPHVSSALVNLSIVLRQLERRSEAADLLIRAVAIDEKILGTDHPHLAFKLTSLGRLYVDMGEYDRGIELLQRACSIRQRHFERDHVLYVESRGNLASAFRRAGRLEESLEIYRSLLPLIESGRYADHARSIGLIEEGYRLALAAIEKRGTDTE